MDHHHPTNDSLAELRDEECLSVLAGWGGLPSEWVRENASGEPTTAERGLRKLMRRQLRLARYPRGVVSESGAGTDR